MSLILRFNRINFQKVFCFSLLFFGYAFACNADERKDAPSIMVSAYSDAKFSKIDVLFKKLETTPGKEEFSQGSGVRVVSFKEDGSIFEERMFKFADFDGSKLCTSSEKKIGKCPGPSLRKKLVVFMKYNPAILSIKFFYNDKEIKSAKVPEGVPDFKIKR